MEQRLDDRVVGASDVSLDIPPWLQLPGLVLRGDNLCLSVVLPLAVPVVMFAIDGDSDPLTAPLALLLLPPRSLLVCGFRLPSFWTTGVAFPESLLLMVLLFGLLSLVLFVAVSVVLFPPSPSPSKGAGSRESSSAPGPEERRDRIKMGMVGCEELFFLMQWGWWLEF